jgi:hypothetical protein
MSDQQDSAPHRRKDRAYFATQIKIRWNKACEGILEIGWLIIDARRTLPRDEYGKFVANDLPFNYSTLQKLQSIAESDRINDPKNRSLLPHSWNTLYEIIHLSDDGFEAGISRGIIRPKVTWKEVKALREEFDPELQIRRAKKSAARVHTGNVVPLRNSGETNQQSPAPKQPRRPKSAAPAQTAPTAEEDTTEALSAEIAPDDTPVSTAPNAPSIAPPLPATVPLLNLVVSYLRRDVTDDRRNALLEDLQRIRLTHPFIDAVQIRMLDGDS